MTHLAIQPLFAADGWQELFGIIVFIFWTALQWLGSRNEAKQQQKPQRPKLPQPVDRGLVDRGPVDLAEGQLPPRNQEDALRSEVEDFLRRVQGKPERKRPARPERQRQPARQQLQEQDEPRTLVSKAERAEPLRQPQRQSTRLPQVILEGHQEGVAEHVAKHLDTRDIVEHSSALGETVGLADERLESHLHEKFDHDLGLLKHHETPVVAKPQAENLAAEIAAMLREPAGMRKLIVANEILRRPEW